MSVINGMATTRIYVDQNITIQVADHVLNIWERHRQTDWKTEAFGVLMVPMILRTIFCLLLNAQNQCTKMNLIHITLKCWIKVIP